MWLYAVWCCGIPRRIPDLLRMYILMLALSRQSGVCLHLVSASLRETKVFLALPKRLGSRPALRGGGCFRVLSLMLRRQLLSQILGVVSLMSTCGRGPATSATSGALRVLVA